MLTEKVSSTVVSASTSTSKLFYLVYFYVRIHMTSARLVGYKLLRG